MRDDPAWCGLDFMPRAIRLAAPVALAAAALSAPVAHADTILSSEPSPPKLTAAGGAAAWSTYDEAAGAWFLATRQAGVIERAAVAPRSVPFDVDLGRDASGRLVASYSRCDRDPDIAAPLGRGCDLYAYDLASRDERLLRGPSSDAASEYMPSMAAGRIAFGRVHERRQGPAGVRTSVYVRSLARGPARRLPGGTLNDDDRTGLTGLDLGRRRLALAWRTAGPAGPGIPYGTAELRVDSLRGGEQTIVTRLVNSYLDYGGIVTPALSGSLVRYSLLWVNEGGTTIGDLAQYDLGRGIRSWLRLPDRTGGVAVSGNDTYYVRCNPEWMMVPGCEVALRETATGADPDVELARSPRPTPLTWYRGWVAYSLPDGSRYRLTLRSSDGATVQPAIAPRSVPFDADLGRGPDGALAVAYSRCRVEPRLDRAGRDCGVYRFDTATGRESRIRGTGSEASLPAIDGSAIAFARSDRRGTSIYLVRDGQTTRLQGPVPGKPRSLDLRGRRGAVVWERRGRARVRVLERGRPTRVLGTATSRSAGFDGDVLTWVQRDGDGTVGVRLNLETGARRVLALPQSATVLVPWTTWEGRSGSYGAIDAAGWSLRTPLMLPELVR
jgi:hypothetical protein